MARRISSLFGLSKDSYQDPQHHPDEIHLPDPSFHSPTSSPVLHKLAKNKGLVKSPSLLDLTDPNGALPPPPLIGETGMRPVSRDSRRSSRTESHGTRDSSGSRPTTPTYLGVPSMPSSPKTEPEKVVKLAKRKTWMPGRSDRHGHGSTSVEAWIAGQDRNMPYDLTPLVKGEKVLELWNPDGDVDVHLFPKHLGLGPSFRVSKEVFADSKEWNYLVDVPTEGSTHVESTHISYPEPPRADQHLHDVPKSIARKPLAKSQTLPIITAPRQVVKPVQQIWLDPNIHVDDTEMGLELADSDIECLALWRNFISFLTGGTLVATTRQPSVYGIFLGIARLLRECQFGNQKGSSWGTIAWVNFTKYTKEYGLADVRRSPERNLEAIVLGELMKSWPLYNEGFAHAVGRLDELKQVKNPPFIRLTTLTISRLERAKLDLQQRVAAVHAKLDDFYFPSMFAGVANSQSSTEAKLVHFKAWKLAFMDFRAFIISAYKRRYGSWPPKASSKKNNFEGSGLNRLLLREVYQDFSDLYDMLVDRQSLTPRTSDMPTISGDAQSGSNETIQHILRSIESEYDRSVPPVSPPIPFDVPLIPALANSFKRDHILTKKDPQAKKLNESDVNALLLGSYNRDSIKPTNLCQEFLEYERRLGTGKTVQELVDNRCGQWLFLYAVLQALPMTVVDARDLQFTEGCESYLCMAPRGGRPWVKNDISLSRSWSNVANGGGVVNMPAEAIDQSVEGVYRRSHCWKVSIEWAAQLSGEQSSKARELVASRVPSAQSTKVSTHLAPPTTGIPTSMLDIPPLLRPRSGHGSLDSSMFANSPNNMESQIRRASMNVGMEASRAPPQKQVKPVAVYNPNITFDNILGAPEEKGRKGKKK